MHARVDNDILYIYKDDVPPYKKGGSIVRNSYFAQWNPLFCTGERHLCRCIKYRYRLVRA